MKKVAYPNLSEDVEIDFPYDLNKWANTFKLIKELSSQGMTRNDAFNRATNTWEVLEKEKFNYWMRYYQEGGFKYKTAQVKYYEPGETMPGYLLPIVQDKPSHQDNALREDLEEQKLRSTEAYRAKILGRLDAAEKLLRRPESQRLYGDELPNLLQGVFELKKLVYSLKKKTASNKIYIDLISRTASTLDRSGFVKSAGFLYNFAQELPAPPAPSAVGNVGNLPGVAPAQLPGDSGEVKNKKPLGGFLDNLKSNVDISESDDEDCSMSDDLSEIIIDEDLSDNKNDIDIEDHNLVVEAQLAPNDSVGASLGPKPIDMPDVPAAPLKVPAKPLEPQIETPNDTVEIEDDKIDSIIDTALEGVTIEDAIAKLDEVSKIFKTREIARQLNLVDMILFKLGISSYFSSLPEAISKNLEASNYISTRIDDILSQLRASVGSPGLDLKNENASPVDERVKAIQNKLKEKQEKEKARKEQRKQQENSTFDQSLKPKPELGGVEQELGAVGPKSQMPRI
jgi:hypothetical protein